MAIINTKDLFPLKLINLMKLKDCPFCGGNARIEYKPYNLPDFAYKVCCTTCHASTEESGEAIQAVKKWNRRLNNGF